MNNHDEQQRRIEDIVRGDPDLVSLLTAARELGIPQWRVVAARIVPHYLAALPASPSAARRSRAWLVFSVMIRVARHAFSLDVS